MKYKLDEYVAQFSKEHPDLWRLCYPRRILSPAGYFNPIYYSTILYSAEVHRAELRVKGAATYETLVDSTLGAISQFLTALRLPTYFVAKEFAEAMAETKIETDLSLVDFKWPDSAMLFVLPDNFVKEYVGVDCPFISMCAAPPLPPERAARYYEPLGGKHSQFYKMSIEPNYPGWIFIHYQMYADRYKTTAVDYVGQYHMTKPVDQISALLDKEMTLSMYEQAKVKSGEITGVGFLDRNREKEVHVKMMNLVIKFLLAMAAMPEQLVIEKKALRPAKVVKEHGCDIIEPETWSASVFGAKYRHPPKPYQGGTHKSPRLHRRHGYFNTYHVGKGRLERKVKWLDAVWVNAGKEK